MLLSLLTNIHSNMTSRALSACALHTTLQAHHDDLQPPETALRAVIHFAT